MSVFLVMLPSPTEIRKESSLHCILGYFCLHEYLFSIGLRILQMSNDKFIENLQKLIQEKETLYNNENINPTLIWELIKSDIRGYAIKYSSEVKKTRNRGY
jgi:hypothetical protein